MTTLRVRWGLFFLILSISISLLAWRFLPRERLLLEHAKRVADTTQWGAGARRFNGSIGNHWLSDHEVLFDRYEGAQHDDRVIYKRNIDTQQDTKLPGLTASRQELAAEVEDSQCISPDGKWFLCSARWGRCLLAEVNGTRHYSYPDAEAGECYRDTLWLPDSRHWLERYGVNSQTYCVLLHDTQHPSLSIRLPVAAHSTAARMEKVAMPDAAVVVDGPDQETNDLGEPVVRAASPKTRQVSISLVPWRTGGRPFARYSVSVPFGVRNDDLKISPDARYVAWKVTTQSTAPLQLWLHRYLPYLRFPKYRSTAIWASRIDGKDRHEIGHVIETTDASEENETLSESVLDELKWLPDGRHLSFEYKNALYTAPIF